MNNFYAKTRAAWRKWLLRNHQKEKNVWLVVYNNGSNVSCVTYPDAVEEALCFGWIDSTANKRDQKSHLLYFAQRKSKGGWSKINKERITRMIDQGLMTSAGLEKIEAAKKDGSWTSAPALRTRPRNLAKAFSKQKKGLKFFEAFPPSVKKIILHWIESAKRKETRANRIEETVTLAVKNIRAHQWKPKNS